MLYLTTPNLESFVYVIRSYPENKRLELVLEGDHYGKTVLHYLIDEPRALGQILYSLSEKDRMTAINCKDLSGMSPISASLTHPKSLEVLLCSLEKNDQLEIIFKYNIMNQTQSDATPRDEDHVLVGEEEEYDECRSGMSP